MSKILKRLFKSFFTEEQWVSNCCGSSVGHKTIIHKEGQVYGGFMIPSISEIICFCHCCLKECKRVSEVKIEKKVACD